VGSMLPDLYARRQGNSSNTGISCSSNNSSIASSNNSNAGSNDSSIASSTGSSNGHVGSSSYASIGRNNSRSSRYLPAPRAPRLQLTFIVANSLFLTRSGGDRDPPVRATVCLRQF